jgi:hypothetical protein
LTTYTVLVDGERVARLDAADEVRGWLTKYRHEHAEDDPSAAHVQVIERGRFAWLTGGKLVDRLTFL